MKRKLAGGTAEVFIFLRWTTEEEEWVSERRPETSIGQHNPAIARRTGPQKSALEFPHAAGAGGNF